jgi:hypothetical protein
MNGRLQSAPTRKSQYPTFSIQVDTTHKILVIEVGFAFGARFLVEQRYRFSHVVEGTTQAPSNFG